MMHPDAIVAKYMRTGKRLVLPGLGAFLRKDSGEVVFVEFLKKDDGVLSSALVTEGISLPQANATIEKYTVDIRNSVLSDGVYIIEGLGRFMRDHSGALIFEYNPNASSAAAAGVQLAVEMPTREIAAYSTEGKERDDDISRAFHTAKAHQSPDLKENLGDPSADLTAVQSRSAERAKSGRNHTEKIQPTVGNGGPSRAGTVASPLSAPVGAGSPTANAATTASEAAEIPAIKRSVGSTTTPIARRAGRRPDYIVVIAIIAALIAIGAMVYGLMVNNDPIIKMQPVHTEEVADTDTENAEVQ